MRTPVGRPKLGSETVSDNNRVAAAQINFFGSVHTREDPSTFTECPHCYCFN